MGGPILLEEDNNIEGRIEGTNSLADGCCNKCIRQLVALQKREIYNSTTEEERNFCVFPGKRSNRNSSGKVLPTPIFPPKW
jgi:hypothetical protein